MNVLDFVVNNWTDILAIISEIIAAASLIVKLTPTPKDDQVLVKVINVLNVLALNPKKK